MEWYTLCAEATLASRVARSRIDNGGTTSSVTGLGIRCVDYRPWSPVPNIELVLALDAIATRRSHDRSAAMHNLRERTSPTDRFGVSPDGTGCQNGDHVDGCCGHPSADAFRAPPLPSASSRR